MALHDTVAEPELVTLVGTNGPQVSPADGVMLKVTAPENPLTATTVTVEAADCPALNGVGEVALIVKSWNLTTAVAECDRDPLEPVSVNV